MTDRSIRADRLALGGLAALAVLAVVESVLGAPPIGRTASTVAVAVLVPGWLFLRAVGVPAERSARWVCYAVGAGLLLFMAVGGLVNLLLPLAGVEDPLTAGPLAAGLGVLLAGLCWANRRWAPPFDRDRRVAVTMPDAVTLGLLLVPEAAVLSVVLLNRTGDNLPLVATLLVVALLPLAVVVTDLDGQHLTVGVFAMSLAAVYHKSIWSAYVYGGHASTVAVWETGRWNPAFEPLLPNAVMTPGLARLAGVHILTQLKVVNPLLVALIPVAVFVAFRNHGAAGQAFLGASVFTFAHPFFFQYPPAGRASMPVLFLALIGAVAGDRELSPAVGRLLGVLFAAGIVVSHYGTSYYVMFALLGALVLLGAFAAADDVLYGFPDGVAAFRRRVPVSDGELPLLTWNYGMFYVAAVLSWYLYTGGGRKFVALIDHLANAYQSLAVGGGTGSTAVRLAADYDAPSIRLAKFVYVTLGLLIATGLLATYYRRFASDERSRFDDQYVALASMLLGLFGATFFVSGEWGGGRPMMIVFSLTAGFAVVGADAAWDVVRSCWDGAAVLDAVDRAVPAPAPRVGFGLLLAVMFVLNTGVAAAVVLGGSAPSNVPLEPRFEESERPEVQSLVYVESDLATHVWLVDHRDAGYPIYGDRIARGQATDKYVAEIAARSDDALYRFPKRNHPAALEPPGVEPGYLLLMGHTVEHRTVSVTFIEWKKLEAYDLELSERDKVYANDHAAVYFSANRTAGSRLRG